jgi:thiol-disulfide isomerase/thioredoxin
MKVIIRTMLFMGIAFFIASCGSGQAEKTTANEQTEFGKSTVEVYYFHATRRCPTCNKIEEIAQNFVEQDYANSDVKFFSINFDEKENKEMVDKYKIGWSSLIIVSGDKNEDITDLAFQVATSDPKQMTDRMKSIIDGYLNIE